MTYEWTRDQELAKDSGRDVPSSKMIGMALGADLRSDHIGSSLVQMRLS